MKAIRDKEVSLCMDKDSVSFLSREDLQESANQRLRIAKIGYIVLSVLICVLGAAVMAVPDFSVRILCRLGGTLLAAFGCIRIVGYFSRDLYRLAFQFDLAFGILLIVLGLVLILRTDAAVHILCVLLGLSTLADALLKVQIAIDSRKFGISQWWMILTTAIFTGIVGVFLLFHPSAAAEVIMTLLGLSFLGEGLLNLVTVLSAVQILQKQYPRCPDLDL